MTLKFEIEYITCWGEEIKLVSGNRRYDMEYHPGGIWTAAVNADESGISWKEYHYECWKNGRRTRREWRGHTAPEKKDGQKTIELKDFWTDIPEAAPMFTSAFADGVFTTPQGEIGLNGQCGETPEEMFRRGWKCAGTAVPVFSLRTDDSFGTGDFHDIRKLADWAAATGQRVLQLLPVNDTTITGKWTDSYPYCANSIYALHPQFIYLPEAGVKTDKEYFAVKAELEALPEVDYERVNREKDRLLRKAFASVKVRKATMESPGYRKFTEENSGWLDAYCVFRILLKKSGDKEPSEWGEYAVYDEEKIRRILAENRKEADYQRFVQFHLNRQLKEARDYARSLGIVLKGDLPIGVSRTGVDAWQNPGQFNMDSQAGAPPDAFSTDGQMWGFPTYDWDRMADDGFAWWKARLKNMEQYFDLFRIDHILGFFRIWEIPFGAESGLLGHFSPALPYSSGELEEAGFDMESGAYAVAGTDTLFIEDPHRKGFWHPRIAGMDTDMFKMLPDRLKEAFRRLHDEFFYRRHNVFWKESAMRKLPDLLASTRMLACGEDLGMIPECVPEVMSGQRILSLEIQRMPKRCGEEFADTLNYPYLSVCATSTHDMSPLRAWWKEDRAVTQHFWNDVLGRYGDAPEDCTPDICRSIILMHLQSPSMFAILPLQDWLSLRPELCFSDPDAERINVPAESRHYWRFRMKTTMEQVLASPLTPLLRELIRTSGRE